MTPFLSDKQRKAAAAAVAVLSVTVILIAAIGIFWIVVRFFATYDHVFLPLAVAGILALVIRPYFDWLRHKVRLPTALALLFLFASLILPVAGTIYLFGALIANQTAELIGEIPRLWDRLVVYLEEHRPELQAWARESPILRNARESLQSSAGPLAKLAGSIARGIISAGASLVSNVVSLFGWAVMPVYMAFFLLMPNVEQNPSAETLPFLKPETRKDAVFLMREFVNLVVVFFRGQLLIALLRRCHRIDSGVPQHHSLPRQHDRAGGGPAAGLLSRRRRRDASSSRHDRIRGRPADRRLCAHPKDHG